MSSNLKSTFDELEFLVQSKKIKEVTEVTEAKLPAKQTTSQETIETPVATNSLRPQVGKNAPIKNPPTEEQEAVINCDADKIKVIALSGAGKTTTLTRYAKKRMKSRGLYVAFNKDIKEEATRKFHSNVRCVTSHGLAYAKFGAPLQHKLNMRFTYGSIYENLKLFVAPALQKTYARILLKTVNNFIASADSYISTKHIYYDDFKLVVESPKFKGHIPTNTEIVRDSEALWQAMTDPNVKIFTTHDCYLKLMQLSGMKLNYDYIMLDEAQDSNPALLAFLEQQDCKRIYVGDPHQSIYGFRNSVDAMSLTEADVNLTLTGSFRFGAAIADFANSLLAMKKETLQLRGLGNESFIYNGSSNINIAKKETLAFISRTNAALFREAAQRVMANKKIYFSGGIQNSGINLLEQLYYLKYPLKGVRPTDPVITAYDRYEDFKQAADDNKEVEWISRCKLLDDIGESLLSKIKAIQNNTVPNAIDADQIFTTAHKSKGLEFDHVVLADDFYVPNITINEKGFVPPEKYEDVNLFYVATTRAKKSLNIGDSHFINWKNLSPLVSDHFTVSPEEIKRISKLYSPDVLSFLEQVKIKNKLNAMKKDNIYVGQEAHENNIDDDPFSQPEIPKKKRRI